MAAASAFTVARAAASAFCFNHFSGSGACPRRPA
jgi:hypothetical protein